MNYISADHIFPISSDPIEKGVIQINDEGTIIAIGKASDFGTVDIRHYSGIILPGFINAHCHLELSHMQGLCETGLGLITFISRVVALREFDKQTILLAIAKKDKEMYESGIQAVGDICNTLDTFQTKEKSPISYYSFVEMFDLMQAALLESTIEKYSEVFEGQSTSGNNKKSLVPHAPYSVTKELFTYINENNNPSSSVSIHNQETADEMLMFEKGKGGFYDFYGSLGMNLDGFQATGRSPVHYITDNLRPHAKNLFVHNTLTQSEDIKAVHRWSENSYWVSCPNANLYIENRLPDYACLMDNNAKICLGTDSIMSNWQLSIWEEIKTIKKYQSFVPFSELFKWATLNGAKALSYDDRMGSIEPGKTPGLVNIDLKWEAENTDISQSHSKRIL